MFTKPYLYASEEEAPEYQEVWAGETSPETRSRVEGCTLYATGDALDHEQFLLYGESTRDHLYGSALDEF